MARNQPFVPVLLFLILGCGTVTPDNDPAPAEQATPARAAQKHLVVFNSTVPAPKESVNFFVAVTSIRSAYTSECLGSVS
jgi:hypothetical protein